MQDLLNKVPEFKNICLDDIREVDLGELENQLSTGTCVGWSSEVNKRMCMAALKTWVCTDTEVGAFAIFFDEAFVALSLQSGRKDGCDIFWFSNEAASKVRAFLQETLAPIDEFTLIRPELPLSRRFFD